MTIVGLHHFNLRVPAAEVASLIEFYVQVLGFTPGARPAFQSQGVWLYANGRPILHITVMNSGETVAPGAMMTLPSVAQRSSAMDHVALQCDDLEGIWRAWRNAQWHSCDQKYRLLVRRNCFYVIPAAMVWN